MGGRLWNLVAVFVVATAILPAAALLWQASSSAGDLWPHLIRNVLPESVMTTAIFLTGIGVMVLVYGASTAWLTSQYRFPLQRFLEWALILPLAIPTYIAAYTYVEFLDFTGPVQEMVREIGGFRTMRDYWFPEIRSTGGAIFLMSAILYPYVYLSARVSFRMQSGSMLEVARVLGAGPFRLFWQVGLPAARPAIAVGVTLALMEALNDIGAVEHLGVRTLTFSVFDTWLIRSNLAGAAQLSLALLLVVALLVHVEKRMRKQQAYNDPRMRHQPPARIDLTGWKGYMATAWCLFPMLAGFAIPFGQLLAFTISRPAQILDPQLTDAALNSIMVAVATAVLCVAAAFMLVHGVRRSPGNWYGLLNRIAGFGYAVPGTILAIGVITALAGLDNFISFHWNQWFGYQTGLLLSGTMIIIIYACSIRFMTIAMGNIEAGYARISPNVPAAARTLGRSEVQAVVEIEIPLLRRALGIAALFVIVETMKELSATLMLRPFNFNTLATLVYEKASRALFEDSAFASLMIVAIGLLPVYWLTRMVISEQRQKKSGPDRSAWKV